MRHRLIIANLLVFLVFLTATLPSTAQEPSASSVVRFFQEGMIEVMKEAESLGVKGRFDRLEPLIDVAFHVPVMARFAAGSHWKGASLEQKNRLVDAFRRMSGSTLATLIDGYSGEAFRLIGEKAGQQGTVLVETELVRVDDSPVSIAYLAKRFKDRWRLVDVIVDDGISELKVRRSEYRRVLKKNGVEGLIEVLNGKADQLVAQQ